MKKINWQSILQVSRGFFWALFLMSLTFTSFPYFPPVFGGGALVRPLALFPLLALIILVTIPYLFTRRIPTTLLSFLPFVLAALASSTISLLFGIDATQGVSLYSRLVRALVTLLIGSAMYVTVSVYPQKPGDIRSSLRWLYAGFSLALVWGTFQAYYVINFQPQYFRLISALQEYVSIRKLFNNRVSGLTYEPNWFAQQISFLLLPWLLASVLNGQSVFRWRWRWLTIEWLLLIWSLFVLVFTFSRVGLIIMVALILTGWLFFRPTKSTSKEKKQKGVSLWIWRLLEVGMILVIVVGLVYFAGSNNVFFSRIWDFWQGRDITDLSSYLRYLGFGARMIYSETAYRIYDAFPITGIGLGNYAFYFNEFLPDQPLSRYPEVLRIVTPALGINTLITPKNLYVRLIAETGLVGMATFSAFLVALFGCAVYLKLSPNTEEKFWGTAGILGMIAFLLSAMSYDSFTFPNMWIVFGLITASTHIARLNARQKIIEPAETPSLQPVETA